MFAPFAVLPDRVASPQLVEVELFAKHLLVFPLFTRCCVKSEGGLIVRGEFFPGYTQFLDELARILDVCEERRLMNDLARCPFLPGLGRSS